MAKTRWVFVLAALLVHCRHSPDEEQIIRWLEETIADCEQGRSREVAARLASDFQLDGKNIHPLQAGRLVGYAISYVQGKRLFYPRPQINIRGGGEVVEVTFPFLLTVSSTEVGLVKKDVAEWLFDIADKTNLMRVDLQLVWHGSNLLVKEARLERFDGLNFRPVKVQSDF